MKKFIISIIGFLIVFSAYADCMSNQLFIFPKGKNIKQNSIFVLDGYAASQRVILELNKLYPIYLKNGNKKIKLIVTQIYVGQYSLTQAILKPEKTLEEGLEYSIHIDNLPTQENFGDYDDKTKKHIPIKYQVSKGMDNQKPVLSSKIKEIEKSYTEFGCGPAMYVTFSNSTKDDSEMLVKTTVKNLKTGKEATYCISAGGNEIRVGHGMCSGAFSFATDNEYEVEFSFMDASGNTTNWEGERIKFTNPTSKNAQSSKD